MDKVTLIYFTVLSLIVQTRALYSIKETLFENHHLAIATIIDLGKIEQALNELKNATEKLSHNKKLLFHKKERFNIGLTLPTNYLVQKRKPVKFQIFEDIAQRIEDQLYHINTFCSRKKRWDVLGDLLNELTGVPSHDMHEKLNDKLQLLEDHQNVLITQGQQLANELKLTNIIASTGMKQMKDLTQIVEHTVGDIETIEENQLATFNVFNYMTNSEKILESSNRYMQQATELMQLGYLHQTNKFAISPETIKSAINHASFPQGLSPIFDDAKEYYHHTLTRASCSGKKIHVTLKIPFFSANDSRNLTLLTRQEKREAEVDISPFAFKAINQQKEIHSYLTLSDLEKCMDTKTFILCNKREIEINNERFGKLLVYDISPHRILMEGEGQGFANCGRTRTRFELGSSVISIVPDDCQLTHRYFSLHSSQHTDFQDIKELQSRSFTFNFTITNDHVSHQNDKQDIARIKHKLQKLKDLHANVALNMTLLQASLRETNLLLETEKLENIFNRRIGLSGIGASGILTVIFTATILWICVKLRKDYQNFKEYTRSKLGSTSK